MNDNGKSGLTKPQVRALEVLEKQMGNVSATCRAVKVSRRSFYNWVNDSPDFAHGVDEVQEALVDRSESILYQTIEKGGRDGLIATLFHLKCRGKARGWVERQEVVTVGSRPLGNYNPEKESAADYIGRALNAPVA